MKPSFALVLTQDTIGLLHRTSQGWQPVGEAAVSDPDLTEALGFLRQSALGLEPRGVTSKLVIPNSEILYTTVQAPGPSVSARRSQIRAALEGMTPYAVRDLVFDWSGKGQMVQVAVVARETLQEAEDFASQHRLGPLSFVGSPGTGQFEGEPWFGPAAAAESLLDPGEKVERDNSPVPVPVVATELPESADAPVMTPGITEAGEDEDRELAPTPSDAVMVTVPAAAVLTEPAPDLSDMPAAAQETHEPAAAVAEPARAAPAPADAQVPATPTVAAPRPEAQTAGTGPAWAEPVSAEPALAASAAVATWPLTEPRPDLAGDPVPPPLGRSARADVIAQSLDVPPEDLPAQPEAKRAVGAAAPAVERLKARLAEQPIDARRFGASPAGAGGAGPTLGVDAAPGGKNPVTPPPGVRNLKPTSPGAAAPLAAPSRVGSAGIRPAAARVAAKGAARGPASMVTSPSIPIPRDRRVNIPAAEAASDARAKAAVEARRTQKADAENLTSFGSRQTRRGKPKYLGLILTGLLLILLAAVAAWSSFDASDNVQDPTPVAAAPAAAGPDATEVTAEMAVATEAAPVVPVPDQRSVAVTPDAAADVPAGPEAEVASDPAPDMVQETAQGPAPDPAQAPAAVAATDIVTGIAAEGEAVGGDVGTADRDASQATAAQPEEALAPPSAATGAAPPPSATTLATSGQPGAAAVAEAAVIEQPQVPVAAGRNPAPPAQDEIFLAMTDPAVPIADLIALAPPLASTDPAPGPQPLPPPFGTVYRFDADGLILPTPEGIVTPEGVLLVQGKPARVPPARPAELAPLVEQAAPPEQAATSEQAELADPAAAGDAASASVAGVIPRPAEPAAVAPVADPALAGARPRPRPADLVPASGDDAALPQSVDTQVTSLLPRERPQALMAEAEAAAQAEAAAAQAEAAAVQSASASLAATAANAAQANPYAVAISLRPPARPRDLSRAVEAAVASIARPPVAEPEEQVVAAAAPQPRAAAAPGAIPREEPAKPAPAAKPKKEVPQDEIDEPEVVTAAPDLPTRANVAKQATFRNAINLSRINLIGVYGSSSNRHALVRQPNGRYIKVAVGDRVDGGKVASISERELRYVKNGRTVTLAMPKG